MSARRNFLYSVLVATTALGGCSPEDNPVLASPDATAAARRSRTFVVDPSRVSDLRTASATDSSIVLTFTEVNDGAGRPASYEVRYAQTPIGWGWGSATVVQDGSCAAPLAGSRVGATLECAVTGLEAETSYPLRGGKGCFTRAESACRSSPGGPAISPRERPVTSRF